MQSSQPVTSIPMAIGFDRSKMTAVSVTEGDFLKQGGGKTDFASRIDPEGQVLVTVSRSGDAGATGSGVVSTINFRASSPVDATRVQLLTVAPISINGQQLPAVPPPPYAIEVQQ
jgi:general secretion pathway protein D